MIPILGPSPGELRSLGLKPLSYMGDDHSPIEFGWVIKGDGKSSIQFSIEPLSHFDGYPSPPQDTVKILKSLGTASCVTSFDSTWADICHDNLKAELFCQENYFFLGGELTQNSAVGKAYYLPGPRARADNCSVEATIGRCMEGLGLGVPWSVVASYIKSQASKHGRLVSDIVAVDCVAPSRNRAKVYVRTLDKSFNAIEQHITLGGILSNDSSVRATVDMLRTLWGLFFPGIGEDEPLPMKHPKMGEWPGFLLYYEMTPRSPTPFPKVYIPVRQYCASDAFIAEAVSNYLVERNLSIGKNYVANIRRLFPHRDLGSRTGIHTYVACCSRPNGPQLYLYLSPEIFAPERVY
ncbi:aromatic prenyltransferase [Pholiota conissans]|uniref:Aromatic prenyltransferase n=1 Tax=Pholiota conissans TaxID=109636 RepID=A0A9P6D3G5_9AGAR|nr:aromatic prenyltransferase [Pholiota conissans]